MRIISPARVPAGESWELSAEADLGLQIATTVHFTQISGHFSLAPNEEPLLGFPFSRGPSAELPLGTDHPCKSLQHHDAKGGRSKWAVRAGPAVMFFSSCLTLGSPLFTGLVMPTCCSPSGCTWSQRRGMCLCSCARSWRSCLAPRWVWRSCSLFHSSLKVGASLYFLFFPLG